MRERLYNLLFCISNKDIDFISEVFQKRQQFIDNFIVENKLNIEHTKINRILELLIKDWIVEDSFLEKYDEIDCIEIDRDCQLKTEIKREWLKELGIESLLEKLEEEAEGEYREIKSFLDKICE